jgi:hypothetical protein
LELRGDVGTGWSLAWKINLWARFGTMIEHTCFAESADAGLFE